MTRNDVIQLVRYGARLYPNTFWRAEEIEETADAWATVLSPITMADAMAAFDRACRVSPDRFPSAYKVLEACAPVQYPQLPNNPVIADGAAAKFASLLRQILKNN